MRRGLIPVLLLLSVDASPWRGPSPAAGKFERAATPPALPTPVWPQPSPLPPAAAVTPTPGPTARPLPAGISMQQYTSLSNVLALVFAPDGGLWAGLVGGVVRWDLASGQPARHFTAADGLGGEIVHDLAFGRDGVLWAATSGGVSRLTGEAG